MLPCRGFRKSSFVTALRPRTRSIYASTTVKPPRGSRNRLLRLRLWCAEGRDMASIHDGPKPVHSGPMMAPSMGSSLGFSVPMMGPSLGHLMFSAAMMGPSLPRAHCGPQLGTPMGHDGPKLAQGTMGPNLGPPCAMMAHAWPGLIMNPKLGPPYGLMGHDGPKLAHMYTHIHIHVYTYIYIYMHYYIHAMTAYAITSAAYLPDHRKH